MKEENLEANQSEGIPVLHSECSRKPEEKWNSNISSILVLLLVMISKQTDIIERMKISVEKQKISPYKVFINLFYASSYNGFTKD